jgi:hypothetical protein
MQNRVRKESAHATPFPDFSGFFDTHAQRDDNGNII